MTFTVGMIVGVSSGISVGVDVAVSAAFAVSVKFAITVCAAAVLIRDTLGVGAAGAAGLHAASKSVPIHAKKNILVFMMWFSCFLKKPPTLTL
jgi:hypothetical protein